MRKILGDWLGRIVLQALMLRYWFKLRIRPIKAEEIDDAARLVTEEFCRREPLCRHLRIPVDQLLPFFRDQVAWAAAQDQVLVAVDRQGHVIGALTIEDYCRQYQPNPALLTPALEAIGKLLDTLVLPKAYQPAGPGEVYYCGLVAVRARHFIGPAVLLFGIGAALHMGKKGYQRAYAKVTNTAVIYSFFKINRILRRKVFELADQKTQKDFAPDTFAPLRNFHVSLLTWPSQLHL